MSALMAMYARKLRQADRDKRFGVSTEVPVPLDAAPAIQALYDAAIRHLCGSPQGSYSCDLCPSADLCAAVHALDALCAAPAPKEEQ
jgi:hypothetical protein